MHTQYIQTEPHPSFLHPASYITHHTIRSLILGIEMANNTSAVHDLGAYGSMHTQLVAFAARHA